MKMTPIIAAFAILPMAVNGATIAGNLGGMTNATGAQTTASLVNSRSYSYSFVGSGLASGAIVTVGYTLSSSTSSTGNFSADVTTSGNDAIFRFTPAANVGSGSTITIELDSISINSGWTLNSVTKTNAVTVTSEGTRTTRFSVNGGSTFDYVNAGSTGANSTVSFSNSNFTDFDAVGDTLSFQNIGQSIGGGQNLRGLAFSFDVTAVPEPGAALLGGLGLLVLLRRRRN